MSSIKVQLPDGSIREVPAGTTPFEIAESISPRLAQAALVLLAGIILAFIIGPLLDIPPDLESKLFWLVLGQCGISAVMFVTRIVGHILTPKPKEVYSLMLQLFPLTVPIDRTASETCAV